MSTLTIVHGTFAPVTVSFDPGPGTIWIRVGSPGDAYGDITNALTLTREQLLGLREVVDRALAAQAPDEPGVPGEGVEK